jgi:hypothetical protein
MISSVIQLNRNKIVAVDANTKELISDCNEVLTLAPKKRIKYIGRGGGFWLVLTMDGLVYFSGSYHFSTDTLPFALTAVKTDVRMDEVKVGAFHVIAKSKSAYMLFTKLYR